MDTIRLPQDFKEFLQLLNFHAVEYVCDSVAAQSISPYAASSLPVHLSPPS